MPVERLKLEALEERQYLERLLVIYQSFQDYIQALTTVVKGEPPSHEFVIVREKFRLKFAEYEKLFCEWNYADGVQQVYEPIRALLYEPETFSNNDRGFGLALPLATTKFQDILEKRNRALREVHERIALLEGEAIAEKITHLPSKSIMATIKDADQLAEIASKWAGKAIKFAPWALELLKNLHH
jgi:hypothetical protein